jgi:hypothetical protein
MTLLTPLTLLTLLTFWHSRRAVAITLTTRRGLD